MKPLEIMGVIDHYTAYDEYDSLKENADSIKAVILTSLRRVIRFDDSGMLENKFMVVRKVENSDHQLKVKF